MRHERCNKNGPEATTGSRRGDAGQDQGGGREGRGNGNAD